MASCATAPPLSASSAPLERRAEAIEADAQRDPADVARPRGQVIYSRVACTKDKEVRVLEIDTPPGAVCRLRYKRGKASTDVVAAPTSRAACLEVRERIRSELIAADFRCQEPPDPYREGP